jgi:uncharacterized membrane-anchored protein YitT (DUF2179 family)/predicted metal-dependent HD superfamily phosphohydrolase
MQYDQAYSFLVNKLEKELSPSLTYHNVEHTNNVITAAVELAIGENVEGDDLTILKTAALFHDAGFLQQAEGHEEISCRLARQYLPEYEYSNEQIEQICRIIMATRLPQTPQDHLGQILADADLYYLGKNAYKENATRLYNEFREAGIVRSEVDWNVKQIEFLSNHHYFTTTAIQQLEEQKQKTLATLRNQATLQVQQHPPAKVNEIIQDIILILLGVMIAGVALKGFLVPNHFFDGGITGISLLVHELYHFNLGIVILIFNLPLIIISYYSVGKRFAFRTLGCVMLLGICLWLLPDFKLTSERLLICIFGGVFLGIGIGLIMRAGAALDGIEVLALYTLKKTSFTITEIILGINIIIFSVAALKFGIETALYSILTYFAATRSIDYVVEGLQAYTGVTIISAESEAIKYELVNKLGRGITVYKGERGFLPGNFEVSADCDIIFTVITRLELRKLNNLVHNVDPKAFVFANTIKEASGGILKRRNRH